MPKSTVSAQGHSLVSLPGCPAGRPVLVVIVTLATKTSEFLPCRSKTAKFPMLVNRVTNPVDSRVVSDGIVGRVNKDHFKILVG